MNPHESNIFSFFKKYTIKDVIYLLSDVWSKTSQNTLKNAWRNLKINLDFEPISEPSVILPYQTILSSNEIQYFITSDDNDPGWRILNDQEIVEDIQSEIQQNDPESELEDESEPPYIITTNKALEGIENYLEWLEYQVCNDKPILLAQAHHMLGMARENQHTNYIKQSVITNFF